MAKVIAIKKVPCMCSYNKCNTNKMSKYKLAKRSHKHHSMLQSCGRRPYSQFGGDGPQPKFGKMLICRSWQGWRKNLVQILWYYIFRNIQVCSSSQPSQFCQCSESPTWMDAYICFIWHMEMKIILMPLEQVTNRVKWP